MNPETNYWDLKNDLWSNIKHDSKLISNSKKVTVAYPNLRGLHTEADNLYAALRQSEFDVIAVTETWLRPDVGSYEPFSSSYKVFRKDREFELVDKVLGGSVF